MAGAGFEDWDDDAPVTVAPPAEMVEPAYVPVNGRSHLSVVDRATALVDSAIAMDGDMLLPSDGPIPPVPAWLDDIPPEGTLEQRTGHGIRKDEPKPAEAAALNWPTLYERGEPPARQWAEPGWIGRGHVTLLVGQGGIGKTLIAQQISSCFAIGDRFLSPAAHPLRTLMWACEDDHDELWRRQLAIAAWQKRDLRAYDNLKLVPRAGLMNALLMTEFGRPNFTPVIETLRQDAVNHQADVVILDNVAQLYGGNENDQHSVTFFINGLIGALPAGVGILLLAHPSRAQGSEYSGSKSWEAAARTRLYLGSTLPDEKQPDEAPDDSTRYLCRRKANYSSKDYRRLTYQAGVLMPEASDLQGGMFDAAHQRQAERVVLEGLAKLRKLGKHPGDSYKTERFLPRLITDHKMHEGCTRQALTEAMRALLVSGQIVLAEVGKDAARRPLIGLVEAP